MARLACSTPARHRPVPSFMNDAQRVLKRIRTSSLALRWHRRQTCPQGLGTTKTKVTQFLQNSPQNNGAVLDPLIPIELYLKAKWSYYHQWFLHMSHSFLLITGRAIFRRGLQSQRVIAAQACCNTAEAEGGARVDMNTGIPWLPHCDSETQVPVISSKM
jgi:hypothetical protein